MMPSETELARFATVVAARLGLRIDPERAGELLERRAAASRAPFDVYLDRVAGGDPLEIRALAGELTVGETYFLRHIEQFRAFAGVAAPDRMARGRLRVLSVGCSSGEEPYTLAMVLRETFPDARLTVHAIDLNAGSIARARTGRYSQWSLRAVPAAFEQRWFQRDGRDAVVAPEIRAAVTFEHGSALDSAALAGDDAWDIVFCRNMMMYLAEERANALIAKFARAIAPGGFLFLGHAETLRGRTAEFALCHTHGTFYYQRHPATTAGERDDTPPHVHLAVATGPALEAGWFADIAAASERVRAMVDDALDPQRGPRAASSSSRSSARDLLVGAATQPALAVVDLAAVHDLLTQERFAEALERLDELAARGAPDREAAMLRALVLTHAGRFADARTACTALLALDAGSAGANYLLALCCDSTGDVDGAAQLAKRAAELDPSFAMPRVHLGLGARRSGDHALAARELTQAIALLEHEVPSRLALYGGGFSRHTLLGMCRAELAAIGGPR
jgi:chemotaxis protein methyltransferase CheR